MLTPDSCASGSPRRSRPVAASKNRRTPPWAATIVLPSAEYANLCPAPQPTRVCQHSLPVSTSIVASVPPSVPIMARERLSGANARAVPEAARCFCPDARSQSSTWPSSKLIAMNRESGENTGAVAPHPARRKKRLAAGRSIPEPRALSFFIDRENVSTWSKGN